MPRYVLDGRFRLWWCLTLANPDAPTVAELGAGFDFTPYLTKDGWDPGLTQQMVDNAGIAENFDAQLVGTYGGTGTLKCFRDDTTDSAWSQVAWGTHGFFVERRSGILTTTAPAAAQAVMVYPAQLHEPIPQTPATNENDKFTAQVAFTSAPRLKAAIAA